MDNPHSKSDSLIIAPARWLRGSVRLPGDKSISHRYAMLAAVAEGRSRFSNFASGADCASTLECLRALGAEITARESEIEIAGQAGRLSAPQRPLDCGNSGSTMRMLAGILAAQEFACELQGDASLSRRPMQRIIVPLMQMGAEISSSDGGRPPLRITGRPLRAIDYRLPVASAQVKSCVLFAGAFASGETSVEEPLPTRDHGELALVAFGAEVRRERRRASIRGGQKLRAIEAAIPGDISSAAFFLCAAAVLPGSRLVLDDVLLNPTRSALLDVLAAMGARVNVLKVEDRLGELAGTVLMEAPASLRGTEIAGATTAALIDELPVLAAIAPFTEGGVTIADARELRVKESDRIAAIALNLRRMGAQVEERDDGLRVPGSQKLRGAELDSAGDHRMAMAFAVAALRAESESTLRGVQAARISYPQFFEVLESLVER